MKAIKHTFYPVPEVFEVLKSAPPKKLSERVNDLILKGLAKEEEEKIRAAYEKYDKELYSEPPRKKDRMGVSEPMMMSKRLFEADDPDDSDEDLV